MSREGKQSGGETLGDLAQGVVQDVERLLGQHLTLLRKEFAEKLDQVKPAVASLGGGTGAAALAGVLGSLAVVHLAHRVTGLPLWACYGGAAGLLGAASCGMLAEGVRRVSDLDPIPHRTAEAIEEDVSGVRRAVAGA